jgi:hypothetical protein
MRGKTMMDRFKRRGLAALTLATIVSFNVEAQDPRYEEQAMRAPAKNLASAYVSVQSILDVYLPMVDAGATLILADGVVDASNLSWTRQDYASRKRAYERAIERRGSAAVGGTYRVGMSDGCKASGSLFAAALEANAFTAVNISQKGATVTLRFRINSRLTGAPAGADRNLEVFGAVVESSVVLVDPVFHDYTFEGYLAGDMLVLRPDADAVLARWPVWSAAPVRQSLDSCSIVLERLPDVATGW